jgi:hypothetical protein
MTELADLSAHATAAALNKRDQERKGRAAVGQCS